MNYSEYKEQLPNDIFFIEGKQYPYNELIEWIHSMSEDQYINTIKSVYKKWLDNNNYISIFTSGSTGKPKEIKLEKSRIYASAKISLAYFKLKKGNKVLLVLPAQKVGGLMLIIRSIIGQLDLCYKKPSLNPFKSELTCDFEFCSLTPAQLAAAWESKNSRRETRKINRILLGGSGIPKGLENEIEKEENVYFHSYGMTETISHVAIRILNGDKKTGYFKALEGVTFESNEDNQLIINAPKILSNPLLTNDVAELIDAKKMIFKGRVDNVVNSGGIKLIVEEIENRLSGIFSNEFYLCGIPDEILGEKLVLVIKGSLKKDESNVLDNKFDFLQKYEVPKVVYLVQDFNYTKNGKLIRTMPTQLAIIDQFSL